MPALAFSAEDRCRVVEAGEALAAQLMAGYPTDPDVASAIALVAAGTIIGRALQAVPVARFDRVVKASADSLAGYASVERRLLRSKAGGSGR